MVCGMWALALCGLVGAATARAVVLIEGIDRVKGRPWAVDVGGPGGWMFLLAQVLHCGIGAAVAAVGGALIKSGGAADVIGFGLGYAATAAAKKIARYTLELLPGKPDIDAATEGEADA